MREIALVIKGSVCEGDFADDIQTIKDSRSEPKQRCRFFPDTCPSGSYSGPHCIPRAGSNMAAYIVRGGTLEGEKQDFRNMARMPLNGFFDPTIQEPSDADTSMESVAERVGKWAEKVLGVHALDAASINQQFTGDPSQINLDLYDVLQESVYDDSTNTWMHSCGSTLAESTVRHPVHLKSMPLTGFGEVVTEDVPYCPSCQKKPAQDGSVIYHEDMEAHEQRLLNKIRNRSRE